MPAGAITLFHIRGIRVGVDYSWFVVLFLIILWLSGFYGDVTGAGSDALGPYLLALASALLFFASILLHELGHAVVAIRKGIGIAGITLWLFGGIARMERDTDTPGTEFKVAIAGPLVTAAISALCVALGIALAGSHDFWEAMRTEDQAQISAPLALVAWLGSINLLVLVFNLVPAFPLDGGRIARAVVWWRTGDRTRATRFAAALGRGFGYLLIGLGIFLFLQGDIVGGLWLGLIGAMLNGAARGAVAQSELTRRIEGVSVSDVMDREPVAIPEDHSVERALDEYFLRYGWSWFPVIDRSQRFIGLLDQATAEGVPAVERAGSTVGEILARDSGGLTVRDDAPLEAVLGNQAIRRLGALVAVDADGRIRGVLTADAVGRALRQPLPQAPGG
jgi:Zn-dependent protease